MSWVGTYGPDRREVVRVQAASWQGHPVFFDVDGFGDDVAAQEAAIGEEIVLFDRITSVVLWLMRLGMAGLAFWNWRSNRVDVDGAAVVFILSFVLRVGSGAIFFATFAGIMTAFFYLAIEPLVTALTVGVPIPLFTQLGMMSTPWLRDQWLVFHIVPVVIAAWCLWVIVSSRKPADSSADAVA